MTNAVAAALALSSQVVGGHLEWAEPLRTWSRPRTGQVKETLRMNTTLGLEMTCGWLRPVCPHLGGILRWNDAELSRDCPLHGSRFAPHGAVLEGPATCALGDRSG